MVMARNHSASRLAALEALVGGATQEEAAQAAGVARMTICRWTRDPAFREHLAQAEGAASQEILGRLRAAIPRAIAALVDLLDSPDAVQRVKAAAALLRAARWVLPRPDAERGPGITRPDAIPSDSEPRRGWNWVADAVPVDPADEPEPPAEPRVAVARGVRVTSGHE